MEKQYVFTLPVGTVITGELMPNSNGERYQYHVESVLGQGGFGITYKVWCIVRNGQIRMRTNFAIKEHFVKGRCHRGSDGVTVEYSQEAAADVEDSLKDFIKEGRLLQTICKVKNPNDPKNKGYQNIVPVNEVIESNNTAYFVMQYLDGGSLRDMILNNGAGMVEEKALSLMVPVCQAVSYIHSHGILHMDIKPENIVMRRNLITTQEEPVLIDFGVSLHFDRKGSLTTKHTSFGRSDGFSPVEQYGAIETFQPTIDVYALGATLFYLLCGKVPPSAFNLTPDYIEKNIPANVSDRTRKAILHAMAKDCHYRTPSAEIFISELENRFTFPIGYILHGPNVNYLITGINQVQESYIKYDAVIDTGTSKKNDGANVTKTHQYAVYEYFVKGVFTRLENESVATNGKPLYYNYLEFVKKQTGLDEVGQSSYSDIHMERELFVANGTTYAVVERKYKPASGFIKVKTGVLKTFKGQARNLKIGAGCLIGGLFLLFVIPAVFSSFKKTNADWSRELNEAIRVKDMEDLKMFAEKDSARAFLPLAELMLESGDTISARFYAEMAFNDELNLDTTEARRILVAIQEMVASDILSKREAAKKDSLEQAKKDSLAKVDEQLVTESSDAENKQQEELKRKEEQKKKEEAQKKEEERKQKEAAQKVADQAYAAKMALQYVNGARTYENHSKAYEWALKADEKTRAEVFEKLKGMDFPIP